MKTQVKINKRKNSDILFLLSAITDELTPLVHLKYQQTLDENGGSAWFYEECLNITNEVMFSEGSVYNKYLEAWKVGEDFNFYEETNDCYDWYHMNKARKLWEERYEIDEEEYIKKTLSEHIGFHISQYEDLNERGSILKNADLHSDKILERRKREKEKEIQKVIEKIRVSDKGTLAKIQKLLGE